MNYRELIRIHLQNHWDKWLVIVIILLGYFQIAFGLFPLKFGAIAYHYPWRLGIVDSIRQGELPLWYFTQHVGVPIHADPQSGAWYPMVWLLSTLGEYSLYIFHLENIIHIIIAAFGMLFLAREMGISKNVSFLVAVAYVFSGVFSDNVLTSWTISMAWMPLVFGLFLRFSKDISVKNILAISLVLTMLITGGYPAFTIVLSYIILIYVVIKSILFLKIDRQKLKYWLIGNGLILIFSFMMSFVLLQSVWQSLDFIGRTQALNISYATDGALSFQSFISFLLPFAVVGSENGIIPGLNSYFTMANSYFGLVFFVFVLYAFRFVKSKKIALLMILSVLLILFSMGSNSIVYNFSFHYFPGFNLFRYPNFVRAFFIPILLLVGAMAMDRFFANQANFLLKNIILSLILFFVGLMVFIFIFDAMDFNYTSFYTLFKEIDLEQRIFVQSFIQIVFLILVYLILFKIKKSNRIKAISALIIMDLVLSFQLNFIYTGYAPRISLSEAQKIIDSKDREITVEKNQNVYLNYKNRPQYFFDYGLMDFDGRINFFGNISFKTKGFETIMNQFPKQYERILNNEVIFVSNEIKPLETMKDWNHTETSKTLYINKIDYNKAKNRIENNKMEYEILESKFRSNSVEMEIKNSEAGLVCFIQNYYPGWRAFVNGKEEKIIVNNHSFISAFVKKGINKVEFRYDNPTIKKGFIISAISFILVLVIFFYLIINRSKNVENQ